MFLQFVGGEALVRLTSMVALCYRRWTSYIYFGRGTCFARGAVVCCVSPLTFCKCGGRPESIEVVACRRHVGGAMFLSAHRALCRLHPRPACEYGLEMACVMARSADVCGVVNVCVCESASTLQKKIRVIVQPQIRRDNPLNLSISLGGGKETNQYSLSNGE